MIIFGHLNFVNPSHALVHVAYVYSKTWYLDLEIPILDIVNGEFSLLELSSQVLNLGPFTKSESMMKQQ